MPTLKELQNLFCWCQENCIKSNPMKVERSGCGHYKTNLTTGAERVMRNVRLSLIFYNTVLG